MTFKDFICNRLNIFYALLLDNLASYHLLCIPVIILILRRFYNLMFLRNTDHNYLKIIKS